MNRIFMVLIYSSFCQISIAAELKNFQSLLFEKHVQKLVDNKNYSSALKLIKFQFKSNPDTATLLKIKGIYLESDNYKSWISYLTELKNQNAYNTDVLFELALFDLKNNDYEQALKKADLIFKITEKNSSAYEIYFMAFEKQNRTTEAIDLYNKYIQENSNPDLLLRRARQFLILNDLVNAKKDLQTYLVHQEPTEQTYLIQHQIYQAQEATIRISQNLHDCLGQFPKSEICFNALLSHNPDQKNKFALDHYENFQTAFIKNESILILIAKQYDFSKLTEKAEDCYHKVSQLHPQSFDSLLPILKFYELNQKSHKSYQEVTRFLAENPKDKQALEYREYFLGLEQSLAQSPIIVGANKPANQEAQKQISSAQLNPENSGKKLFYSQDYKRLLTQKNLLEPNHPNYFFRLGQVLYLSNQTSKAIAAWSKTPKTASSYASSVNNLTIAMAISGLKTKAIEHLKSKNVSEFNPAQMNKLIDAIQSTNYGRGRNPSVAAEFKKNLIQYLDLDWE